VELGWLLQRTVGHLELHDDPPPGTIRPENDTAVRRRSEGNGYEPLGGRRNSGLLVELLEPGQVPVEVIACDETGGLRLLESPNLTSSVEFKAPLSHLLERQCRVEGSHGAQLDIAWRE
jgi:hypothetical protein